MIAASSFSVAFGAVFGFLVALFVVSVVAVVFVTILAFIAGAVIERRKRKARQRVRAYMSRRTVKPL